MSDENHFHEELRVQLQGEASLSADERAEIEGFLAAVKQGGCPAPDEKKSDDIRTQIAEMLLPQKVKAAMFGNETCRSILINDTNKLVQAFVLNNPRIQLGEVEAFAKNPNISDFILRQISSRKEWMKSYTLRLNLVTNPKTPPDISLKWLRFLHDADLKRLAKSKGVPQVVAVNARRQLADGAKK